MRFPCPTTIHMKDTLNLIHPYQPFWKIKNTQTHAGSTSIRDVIVMLKWRHHVASQVFRVIWMSFLHFSNIRGIKWSARKRIHYFCEDGIHRIHHWCSVGTEKSQPKGPPFQWETNLGEFPHWTVDQRVGTFLEALNTNDRFFFSYTTTVRYSTV